MTFRPTRMTRLLLVSALMFCLAAAAPAAPDRLVMPGVISTAAAEVRIAYRSDGRQIVWGAIGRAGAADQQDIWEMHRAGNGWSRPARVSFDSDAVEFDPAFSPDGRSLYFDSDRPGGLGGTDIYVADVDPATNRFSPPRNLGASANSRGDEWAPTPMANGKLIFASDGWGGLGRHDLFETSLGRPSAPPRNLGPNVNGPQEDFDPALTPDGSTLIFSSGTMDDQVTHVTLFIAHRTAAGWGHAAPLDRGCSDFVIGASISPRRPRMLNYAAKCDGGRGRMDIRETSLPGGKSR